MLKDALAEPVVLRVCLALVMFHDAVPFAGKALGNFASGS